VAGDWTGTGIVKTTKIGVFRPSNGRWYLDFNNNGLMDDLVRGPFGLSTDKPVVGDWTGNGIAKIGVFRPSSGRWYLDSDNEGDVGAVWDCRNYLSRTVWNGNRQTYCWRLDGRRTSKDWVCPPQYHAEHVAMVS
jgi:hypothetical protein